MWRTLLSLVEKNSYRQRGLLQPPQAGPQPPPLKRAATCPKAEGGGPHHSEQRCEPQMPAPLPGCSRGPGSEVAQPGQGNASQGGWGQVGGVWSHLPGG